MKNFLVLLIYLTGPFISVHSFLGNLPPHPWFLTSRIKRLQPRHRMHGQDFWKLMYWKHLLELECFKEICGQNDSGYKRPFEMTGKKQIPAFRNDGTHHRDQISNFYKMRKNLLQSEPQARRKFFENERIILRPFNSNFTQKKTANFQRILAPESTNQKWNLKSNPKETTLDSDFSRQKADHRLPPNLHQRTTEDKNSPGKFVPPPRKDTSLGTNPDHETIPEFQSSTEIHPEVSSYGFRHPLSPNRIQPYEVKEVIEEHLMVGADDDSQHKGSFIPFVGKTFSGHDYQKNKTPKQETKKKNEDFQNIIDNSVNRILKGLINPVNLASSLPKDADAVRHPKKPATKAEALRTFTSHPFSEKANEDISGTSFRQTYSSPNKIQPNERPYSRRQETTEAVPNFVKLFKPDTRSRGFDFNPSFEKEYLRNFLLLDSSKRPAVTEDYDRSSLTVFDAEQFQPESVDDFGRKPRPGPSISELSSMDPFRSLDLLKNLMADHQPDFAPTEEMSPTMHKTLETSTNPSTSLSQPSKIPEELLTNTPASKDAGTFFSEADTAITTQDFMETDASGASDIEHNFIEFSDRPMSFDLLTTTIRIDSKKDQDTIWKSSRRMHFGHESRRTTAPVRAPGGAETDQRRSDILITDNFPDYIDDENNLSTLSYFEELRRKDALFPSDANNLTSDVLIPLIPVIVNDLREGRIPSQDIPLLSRALGKYWTPILALTNFTNLDLLPLIKMKDEKDLKNVIQNFLPEDNPSTTTGTGTIEGDYKLHDDYSQYMDEYKDLYTDILGQELADNKRRFRPKRDAEDDLKALEATREYFDSLEEEQRDEESDYIFEDIIYDEMSEGEDARIFELMEVSDVQIDKEM